MGARRGSTPGALLTGRIVAELVIWMRDATSGHFYPTTSIATLTRTGVTLGDRRVFCQGPGIASEENKRKIFE